MNLNINKRLERSFFARPTLTVARALLGKMLVFQPQPDKLFRGLIVETEAYLAADPASHAFRGPTPKNAPMFGPPGHAYIYFIYGMYFCFNIVTEEENVAGAVLIRALQPLAGLAVMRANRQKSKPLPDWQLTNGPGKLCQAFGLDKQFNAVDLCGTDAPLYVSLAEQAWTDKVCCSPRIGIRENQPALWRFFGANNPYVSKYNFK